MHRRMLVGGAGAIAGVAGMRALYRAAPAFWDQYAREFNRPIAPAPERPRPDLWPDSGLHAAWLGHATVLLKVDGATILTDPVFSDRVGLNIGPLTLGLKRLVSPALKIKQLPRIDLLLLSHAHMDHMDIPTLRAFEDRGTAVVTAAKTSDLLRVSRYRSVQELGWDEHTGVGPLQLRAFRVNHWGARMRTDTYRGYNGYTISAGRYRILFAGDTAATQAFRTVRTSRQFDLSIMPVGAYNPWIYYHCTPEQAWQMSNDAGTEFVLPVHHRTFQLSREPLTEPMERLHAAAGKDQHRIAVERVGQEFTV